MHVKRDETHCNCVFQRLTKVRLNILVNVIEPTPSGIYLIPLLVYLLSCFSFLKMK